MRDAELMRQLYPDSEAVDAELRGRELRRFLAAYGCSLAVAGAVLLLIARALP